MDLSALQGLPSGVDRGAVSPNSTTKKEEPVGAQKFGEIWDNIQSRYGEKPKKQREIKKTLDKDDFLKIMVTQMKNQDPTEPFKADQFATQLAQFASVEQLKNINSSVERLQKSNQPMEKLAMSNMIGKTIVIDRERFQHVQGTASDLSYDLPKAAKEVNFQILNSMGEVVEEKSLGAQEKGVHLSTWDGYSKTGIPFPAGTYIARIEAIDDKGLKIELDRTATEKVIGVSYQGEKPVFLVGNSRNYKKVLMEHIVRIDDGSVQEPAKGLIAPPMAQLQPSVPPNRISSNLPASLQKMVSRELEAEGPRGFPNGLQPEFENLKGGDVK